MMLKPEMKAGQNSPKPEQDYKKLASILTQQRDRTMQALLDLEIRLALLTEENQTLAKADKDKLTTLSS